METYNIAGDEYYIYSDIEKVYPKMVKGCKTKTRFIEKNDIQDWTYGRCNKKKK